MPRSSDNTTPAAGLYRKFTVMRTDGSSEPGGKHERCHYFVLDWVHDKFAVPAALAYAAACEAEYPELAADLRFQAYNHPYPKAVGPAPEPCPACNSTPPCNCSEYEVLGAIVEGSPIPSSRTPGMSLGPAPEPVKPSAKPTTPCSECGGVGCMFCGAPKPTTCGALANDGTACTRLPHPESPDYHTDGTEYCWIGGTGHTPVAGTAPKGEGR